MKKYTLLLTLGMATALPFSAQAATYYVDFSDIESPANGYTVVSSGQAMNNEVISLLDGSGNASGITFSFTSGSEIEGDGSAGTPSPTGDAAIFDSNATSDYFFRNSQGDPGGPAEMVFSGLDTGMTYEFTYFGSRSANDNRLVDYTLTNGTDSSTVTLAISTTEGFNTSNVVTSDALTPNGSGNLTMSFVRNSASQSSYSYINALRIVENPVPEPSTYAAIAGFLALGIAVLRRRKQ